MIEFEAARKRLISRGKLRCRIVSDSMYPLLDVGSEIEVEPVTRPERFDLVVFWERSRLTCHYVWSLNSVDDPPTVTTRSLKNPNEDDLPVPLDKILGRVVSHALDWRTRAWLIARSIFRERH